MQPEVTPYTRTEADQLLLVLFDSFIQTMAQAPEDTPIGKLMKSGYGELAMKRIAATKKHGIVEDTFRGSSDISTDELTQSMIGDILGDVVEPTPEEHPYAGKIVYCLAPGLDGGQYPIIIEVLITGRRSDGRDERCEGIPINRKSFKPSVHPLPNMFFDSEDTARHYRATVPPGHKFYLDKDLFYVERDYTVSDRG